MVKMAVMSVNLLKNSSLELKGQNDNRWMIFFLPEGQICYQKNAWKVD